MRNKLVKDLSANTLQTIITQFFGLAIFYITSKYLTKNDFGELNWSSAVASTIIAISSLGLDLVFVRRVAAGENILTISGIHYFHTLITGFSLGSIALVIHLFVPSFTGNHPFFFFIFLNLAIVNVANSFKLCMNGLETYKQLAILAVFVNTFKFALVLFLYLANTFTIANVIFSYMAASTLELMLGYFLLSKSLSVKIKPTLNFIEYKYFILESLPQLGVVVFDSALSRIDWILLGIISTQDITAEYSFAYKIFELSKLPVLIIAPVLLTRFTKIFANGQPISDNQKKEISFFLKLELFIVLLIPIVLVCTWTPLIDYFTNNKYGLVNETNFKILATCIPIVCIINFLWTIGFVQGQLKTIMVITIAVSALNVLANLILIPFYGSLGASCAFLFCSLVQLILYLKYIKQTQLKLNISNCIISFTNALLAIIIGKFSTNNIIFTTIMALSVFIVLTFITSQLNLKQLKQIITKQP